MTAIRWPALWACLSLFSVLVASADLPLEEINRLNNASLLWGPYRPNLYFGVRPRIPKSILASLMWGRVDNYNDLQNYFRHTCEQNEGMEGYGWDEYDVRYGGTQTIHDVENGLDLTTTFTKLPGDGTNGGNWGVRVKGVPRPDAPADLKMTVIFLMTQEGLSSELESVPGDDPLGYDGDVTLLGKSDVLGDYKLVVTEGKGKHPFSDHPLSETRDLSKTTVQYATAPAEHLWQAKAIIFKVLRDGVDSVLQTYGPEAAPPSYQVYQLQNKAGQGNVQIVQKVFEGAFEFDILFSTGSADEELTSDTLTKAAKLAKDSFNTQFGSVFKPKTPFAAEKYAKFGKSMLSNLMGGIGYFEGNHLVDRSNAPEYDEDDGNFWEGAARARARKAEQLEGDLELFSSIPSRPFFPRGFLWDEGFHLLPIAEWDMDVTLEIVKSWFNLMDEDGWIPREMILGLEARSKVPEEFQVQYPHYANPPTLFFVVNEFVKRLMMSQAGVHHPSIPSTSRYVRNPSAGLEYLRDLYPLLQRQFNWFRRTQFGDIQAYDRTAYSNKEAYRWRGRTPAHILTSGLDDYPRPQPPSPAELHVDLMSWVGLMAKTLINVGDALGETSDLAKYKTVLDGIEHNLDDLHWSEAEGCYCDATVDDYEENELVCHKGYISLFPFLIGLMDKDGAKMGKILDLMSDPEELWSDHGLRSLSKKDALYGTGENYWRSPVWININYLAIKELYNLAAHSGAHAQRATDLYTRLRRNIVETVYKSWEETGFAWEQYNPETGKGQRTQHFTGWTSLVVKIMAMPDLSPNVKDEL